MDAPVQTAGELEEGWVQILPHEHTNTGAVAAI
jgi:hypothetical protein